MHDPAYVQKADLTTPWLGDARESRTREAPSRGDLLQGFLAAAASDRLSTGPSCQDLES
jgi:hypothetical protein